jgi:hypothetical protein
MRDLPGQEPLSQEPETRRSRQKRLIIFSLLLVGGGFFLATGCVGYHVGNQFLFRSDIRSVHVPVFESDSYRRFLGQQLTEAVIKEISNSTPLVIAEPQLAHSFLRGRILSDSKQVLGENRFAEPRALNYVWRIEVTWTDRAGVPLMPRQVLRVDREAVFIPEGGQSLSSAQLKLIERLARDIVGQMEVPVL